MRTDDGDSRLGRQVAVKPHPGSQARGGEPLRALVVEDDRDDVLLCRAAIADSDLPCEVRDVRSLHDAIEYLETEGCDIVLVDLSLPDARGLDAITTLASRFVDLPIVVLTGLCDEEMAARALHAGAQDYLVKDPSNAKSLNRAMRFALERKQAEQTRRARDAAEAANRAKSAFLSRMSHELRTPLTAILGFAQLLETECDGPQQELVRHILQGGNHLKGLVDEVLDVARIDAGELTLSVQPIRLVTVLTNAVNLIRPLAAARDVTVDFDASGAEHLWVVVDGRRLSQVFLNLLSNAVKYNRAHGQISVVATPDGADIRVEVSDCGEGLTETQLAGLFTPFDRLGAEATDIEGTGLGLVITKHLVEAMGGVLGVQSAKGVGTTAWTTWTTCEPPDAATEPVPAVPARPANAVHSVLYVDDNPANIVFVERILARRPAVRLFCASRARDGLHLAQRHRPSLILLDLNLPDMPGEDVLMHLRLQSDTHKIPVIVMSADASPATRARLLTAGALTYITKPFDINEFLHALDGALPAGGAEPGHRSGRQLSGAVDR
jgi:signal transduction histidine kinase